MPDLSTTYMGLKLRNPIIVGSSDFTRDTSGVVRCEEAGAGAVVLKSIFEEQFMVKDGVLSGDYNIYPEALDYLRSGGLLEYAPQKMCQMLEEIKKKTKIPIIASINCQTLKLWPSFAKQFEDAGADGLELNIYFLPIDPTKPGSQYEDEHIHVLKEIKNSVSIPVSIKLASQVTSIPYLANRLADAGCDALVFFNWFMEPDIDVHKLKTKNTKGKGNFHQSLRWVALMADRVDCDLASSGGLEEIDGLIKQILAGAKAAQACTLFYQKGLQAVEELLSGLETWMEERHLAAIEDFRGELSFKNQETIFKGRGEAEAYFRAQYLKTYKKFE